MEHLDKALFALKAELQNNSAPDLTGIIQQKFVAKKTINVQNIRRYMIAAAFLLAAFNGSALWYLWSNQSSVETTSAIEELYTDESNWNTFLTQAD